MINFNAPIVLAGAAVKTTLSLMAPVLTWGMCLASLAVPYFAQANDSGRGRHKQLYAVPVPGKVVIDGQLDDWDLSGQVEMFVIQATRGTMNAKFAVMYDADAIYLGADINDPSPMMNMRDPRTDPGQGWNADSCQFRLTTDPKVGYPILDESTFKYKGKGDPTETRDDIVHLTLWHYTETGEPQLAMQQGMTYRDPKNASRGLVPQDQFQAKYLKRANGTGYSFEYRIPWKTLNAKAPLKTSDVVASTVQFNYSRPDGQMTAGGAAWAYDLLREAGFPYQSTKCWGKLVFSPTGNVDRKLVLEGVPPDRPLPLDFSYTLPEDTECTIQLFNEKNENVRMLVPQQERLGGANTERWDGCHVAAGGGNAKIDLHFDTPLAKRFLLDQKPSHHTFGITDARIIASKSPERSTLLHRLKIRGNGQMPQLATSQPDTEAIKLFEDWIRNLEP